MVLHRTITSESFKNLLACFLIHLLGGPACHFTFLHLLWQFSFTNPWDTGNSGAICTRSTCKLFPSFLLLARILPLSHRFVMLKPVHNISFSKNVFDLRAVQLLFQARRGSFQPVLPPNIEPRCTDRNISNICALD